MITKKQEREFIKLQEALEEALVTYDEYTKNTALGALCQAYSILVKADKFKPLD